jgi:hypothetical protein
VLGDGDLLRQKIRLAAHLIESSTEGFWRHPRMAEMFPEFLIAIHGSVRATVPLMRTAAHVALTGGDALCPRLAAYFQQHIEEELEHDEWLLDDLAAIGYPRHVVLDRLPKPAVAGLVGAQYYWIFHAHPVALLGFFAVLEGHPPRIDHLDTLERETGLPRAAFRMLRHHAELDGDHADELFALVDDLPLIDRHRELLGLSALHTIAMVRLLFDGLLEQFSN